MTINTVADRKAARKLTGKRVALHPTSEHLEAMLARADAVDVREGLLAYPRYNEMMRRIAERFEVPLDRTVAAFVSLSPNNDYVGNLRSLISLLVGMRDGTPLPSIRCSTYRHCLLRAYAYVKGEKSFVHCTKGLKILNFYHNILCPDDARWVTIDGHMVGAWQGQPLTMKEALIAPRNYIDIKQRVIELAFSRCVPPSALQATIWFARKRELQVIYNPQQSLFHASDDAWRTLIPLDHLQPYPVLVTS